MTDKPLDEIELEELERRLDAVARAVGRADESLTLLAGVPIAGTQGARHAMNATRLTVLERLLDDVRRTVGLDVPVPAGQMELDG